MELGPKNRFARVTLRCSAAHLTDLRRSEIQIKSRLGALLGDWS